MLQADIELRLSCGVKEVECLDDQVRVRLPDGTTEFFDHVIVATQANTALRLVKDLSKFQTPTTQVIHFLVDGQPHFTNSQINPHFLG